VNPVKNDLLFESQFTTGVDYFKTDLTNYYDQVGTVRVEGFTDRKFGAADRSFDALEFVVTKMSETVSTMLSKRMPHGTMDVDGQKVLKIRIEVPHQYDPTHVVEKSTSENRVVVVLLLLPQLRQGGFGLENEVMMFQKTADLEKKYVEEYSDAEYEKVDSER